MKKLVSKKELRSVLGVPYSPQHIARLEAVGRFPKRIQVGPNRVAWLQAEVEKCIEERVAASRTPAAKTFPSGNR
jgi:prophage regulatory protein